MCIRLRAKLCIFSKNFSRKFNRDKKRETRLGDWIACEGGYACETRSINGEKAGGVARLANLEKLLQLLFSGGKKPRGTGQGQEGSFAWTAYSHFRRFVDNRDTTRCYTIVEELRYEYSKMKIKIILSIYVQLIL